MKRFLSAVVAVAVIFAFGSAMAKNDESTGSSKMQKLAYVDLNRALNEVDEGKAAKARLEKDGQAKKQKLDIMQSDIMKLKDELDKKRLILSQDALNEKQNELQKKFLELQKTSVDFEQEFAKMESEYIKPISDKLQKVIANIGAQEGYTLIVPKEMALYSLPGMDLTDQVIAQYNKTK